MKRKILVVFMILFTVFMAVNLFVSLICGAPANGDGLIKYILCAAGTSVLLPASFTFFFLTTLHLSEKLEEKEQATVVEEEKKESEDILNTFADVQIPALVNAIAKKQNLTAEEEERIISFIEDL